MRVISCGGGRQSSALVVLAAQGKIGVVDAALFANVGDDSEHPATLAYVHDHLKPWSDSHGLPFHVLHKTLRDGTTETLLGRLTRPGSKSIPIPVRMSATGPPGHRSCTADFKIRVIGKWLKAHGASTGNPADVLIGFASDEAHRVSNRADPWEVPAYPLLDLRLNTEDCKRLVESVGLPTPPRSACYFCPFHSSDMWSRMRRDEPVLFHKAADLERALNVTRVDQGRDPVYLSRHGRPLDQAVETEQEGFAFGAPDTDTCDEGHCWT